MNQIGCDDGGGNTGYSDGKDRFPVKISQLVLPPTSRYAGKYQCKYRIGYEQGNSVSAFKRHIGETLDKHRENEDVNDSSANAQHTCYQTTYQAGGKKDQQVMNGYQ